MCFKQSLCLSITLCVRWRTWCSRRTWAMCRRNPTDQFFKQAVENIEAYLDGKGAGTAP